MSFSQRLFKLPKILIRQLKTSTIKQAKGQKCEPEKPKNEVIEVTSSKFAKLKENQKFFQADDGVVIWLKKGTPDKILYQLTWLGIVVGLGMSAETLYRLSLRK